MHYENETINKTCADGRTCSATTKKIQKKGSKPKNKCPTTKEVQKCKDKIKNLKPKQKACKDLQGIGKKDIDSIIELVKKWNKQKVPKKDCVQDKGETKYHYVKRLGYHFTTKLKKFEKQLAELTEKKNKGKKIDKGCNAIQHYARQLTEQTCKKIQEASYGCKCKKVVQEKKVCKMFDGCYDASVTAQKNNEREIRKKNAAAKLEWRAVGRIECLLKVLGGKNGADKKQLEACVSGPQISTKPLDLKYGKVPSKPKCALKGLTPEVKKKCTKDAEGKKKPKEPKKKVRR